MEKDFGNWIKLKEKFDNRPTEVLFREGEIWWTAIGCNVGEESNGKSDRFSRPVIVFRKLARHSFYGIPMTSKIKNGSWYVPFKQGEKESRAMLNQMRIFDSRRLIGRIGALDDEDWKRLRQNFHEFFA